MKKFPIIWSMAVVFSLFIFATQIVTAESGAKAPGMQRGAAVMVAEESYGEKLTNNTEEQSEMSEVSRQVKILLDAKDDVEGVGQRVREIAKEQVKSQERVAEKLQKMEEKKVWFKKMFGYDREAVTAVQDEMSANQERIDELKILQSETVDKIEAAQLQASIDTLVQQNDSLDEAVQTERQQEGVWGWFRGFFKRN